MTKLIIAWFTYETTGQSQSVYWKTTFDGRQPLTEEDLWRKATFDGRRPSIGCLAYYLKKLWTTPHLDSYSPTDPKPEILSAVQSRKRISRDGRNVRGITHAHVCRKDISRQRWLSINHVICMRMTSKTKRTCTLLEGTQRWTYSAFLFEYFWLG